MFAAPDSLPDDKELRYESLLRELQAVAEGESDLVANLANTTALLAHYVPVASWVGFYMMRGAELVLGPFQGKVACVRIALDRGVCGAAASSRQTQLVPDVEQFPGHIACDARTRSEVVVPVLRDGKVVAVLDLDSVELAAFDAVDASWLEKVAQWCSTLAW